MKQIAIYLFCFATLLTAFTGCKIGYSFTGASIAPDVKSVTVYYFPNRARLVNPNLSERLTQELRDKFTRQTSLNYKEDGGDLEFEGTITGYEVRPMSIQTGDVAAQSRLTVTVKVKFTNNKDHKQDFDTSISAYEDFPQSQNLSDVEDQLLKTIIDKIVDDIFNKSVANW